MTLSTLYSHCLYDVLIIGYTCSNVLQVTDKILFHVFIILTMMLLSRIPRSLVTMLLQQVSQ